MGIIDFFRDLLNPKDYGYYSYYDYSEEQRRQRQSAKPVTEESKTAKKPVEPVTEAKEKKEEQTLKTPEKPTRVEPIGSNKPYYYEDMYGPMPLEYDWGYRRESHRKYYRKEKKDVIVFVIEDSIYTSSYAKNIEAIVKRIVDSNKSSFFMMLKVGNDKQFFEPSDYESLIKDNMITRLFNEGHDFLVDYVETLEHITKFCKDTVVEYEYKGTKYDIQNISVIFIGSGKTNAGSETIEKVSKLVADIKNNKKTKTIKYFCMTDRQSIGVAKLGFPVIGHIDNDFYS